MQRFDQETEEFLRKWEDIYLDLDIIFSDITCMFRLTCYMTKYNRYSLEESPLGCAKFGA